MEVLNTLTEAGEKPVNVARKQAKYVLSLNFVRTLFQQRYKITIRRQIAHTPYLLNRF